MDKDCIYRYIQFNISLKELFFTKRREFLIAFELNDWSKFTTGKIVG